MREGEHLGSRGGGQRWGGQSDTAKGCKVPLECLCFMNRGLIGAGGTYSCV